MDVNLSDNVVDVVYKMFDENGNNFLLIPVIQLLLV